jgi:hypothetical protein
MHKHVVAFRRTTVLLPTGCVTGSGAGVDGQMLSGTLPSARMKAGRQCGEALQVLCSDVIHKVVDVAHVTATLSMLLCLQHADISFVVLLTLHLIQEPPLDHWATSVQGTWHAQVC